MFCSWRQYRPTPQICPFAETILHNVTHRRYKEFGSRPDHDAILVFQSGCSYDNEEHYPSVKSMKC